MQTWFAINKFDKAGALDALADVRKQYKRNHQLWTAKDEELPIVGTMASNSMMMGSIDLFELMMKEIEEKTNISFGKIQFDETDAKKSQAIIPSRTGSLFIRDNRKQSANYDQLVKDQSAIASKLYQSMEHWKY